MDASTIQTLISTLGFPIITTIFLAWFVWKLWIGQQEQNKNREDKLYEFIGKAQLTNEKLVQTNSEFVSILNTYKSDLDNIKTDVSEIKHNLKG